MSRPLDPIAVQLRAERNRRGLSLPETAIKVGLPAVVIGSYERGDRIPPLDRLRIWSEGLDHKLLAVPATTDADESGTHMRIEYGVSYPHGLVACDTEEEARGLAERIAGGVVVARVVRTTGWEPQR